MMTSKRVAVVLMAMMTWAIVCLSAVSQAAAAEMVFPSDQAVVVQGELRVIGLAVAGEAITLGLKSAKGEQSFSPSVKDGAFNQLVTLEPGLNTITLRADGKGLSRAVFRYTKEAGAAPKGFTPLYLHSKQELTAACDQCHPPGKANYQDAPGKGSCISAGCHDTFGDKKFKHGPFKEGRCLECHNPHGSPFKRFLKKGRSALCFSCHTEDANMTEGAKVVHFPVKQGECTLCHEHHQSTMPYHLKGESIAALCNNCHGKSMVTYKFMHDPFASGDCNACHSPHVSEFKGLLVAGGSALCLTCHQEREEEFKRKYVHEPVKKSCILCHDQHGSDTAAHLRTPRDKDGKYLKTSQPLKESCLLCHRKLDPEVAGQIEHSKVTHKPVAEGKCTACHTPHSTNFKKQLKTSTQETCFPCHEPLKKLIRESKFQHGPVRNDECGQCHLVHGSDHRRLLRANFTENFTEDFAESHYELCFNCHNKKVYLEANSLETGFRDGSRNLHFLHVNREKDGRTCMTCHDIHASNQPRHIRASIPYKAKFTIKLDYTKTETGGGCVVGCHVPRKYDRENPVQAQ